MNRYKYQLNKTVLEMMIDDDAGGVIAPTDVVLSIDDSSNRSIQSNTEKNDVKKFDNEHNVCVHHNSYVEGDDKDRFQAREDYTINETIMIPNNINNNSINNNNYNNNNQANNKNNNQANNKNIAYTNLPSHGNNTNEEGIDQVNTQSNSSIPTQSNTNRWQWMERLGVTLLETVDRIGTGYLLHSIHVMIVIDEMIVYTCIHVMIVIIDLKLFCVYISN